MASRPVFQEQNRGDAAVAGAAKPKNMAAQGRNRRALGDIGNMVTLRPLEGKPVPNRPVTRSFCAQLLANAQANAAENKKRSVKVNLEDGVVGKQQPVGGGKKAAQVAAVPPPAHQKTKKQDAAKPKPECVIEISPDTLEKAREAAQQQRSHLMAVDNHKEKAAVVSTRKNKSQQSLSAILTARSKAVCGVDNRPKEQKISDIDLLDVGNELAAVEYVEDMYKFYKLAENEGMVHDYIGSQPEISESMRAILVDWLIEVHDKFELMKETLYLTINIVDRFLAAETVPRRDLQLVGVSAMLIASKYEEIWAPEVNEFVLIADRTYTNQQVLVMEKRILGKLEWSLTVPTPYVFLVRFIKAASASTISFSSGPAEPDLENLVNFFAELGMMSYECIRYCPSMLAAGCVYAARRTMGKVPVWNKTLELHTGFSEFQVTGCAKLLVCIHEMVARKDRKQKVIFMKYSSPSKGAVALFPPAKAFLAAPGYGVGGSSSS